MAISSNKVKRTLQQTVQQNIQPFLADMIASEQMTRRQHLYLTSILLSNQNLTDEDRLQINKVLELVQSGRLKLVN